MTGFEYITRPVAEADAYVRGGWRVVRVTEALAHSPLTGARLRYLPVAVVVLCAARK